MTGGIKAAVYGGRLGLGIKPAHDTMLNIEFPWEICLIDALFIKTIHRNPNGPFPHKPGLGRLIISNNG